MFTRPWITRPAAGTRQATRCGRQAALALLAALAMLGAPLAVQGLHAGHHHAPGTSPHGDASGCHVCLWQAHAAAEPVMATAPPAPGSARLAVSPGGRLATAAVVPACGARAPPALPS